MNRYIITALLLVPFYLSGQEVESKDIKTFGIGVVPQYAISNGTRVDLDFRLKKKGQWLIVSPQVYLNTGSSSTWNYDELIGVGLDLQHRFFFKEKPEPKGAYLGYGPVFQFFSVKDQGLTAYNFEESGVEYIGFNEDQQQTNIYKFGGNLVFGMQTVINEFFYIDAFIGTGIRLSFDNRTSGLHGYYNDWWGDIGYSGTLIVAGIRFGISL